MECHAFGVKCNLPAVFLGQTIQFVLILLRNILSENMDINFLFLLIVLKK